MNKFLFFLGAIPSTLTYKPNQYFMYFICFTLAVLGAVMSYFYSPIANMIPGFFAEWWNEGTYQNLPMYLVVSSYSLLIFAVICKVKVLAFESAVYIKNNFGRNMPLF